MAASIPDLPLPIVNEILDYLDLDTHIALGRRRRLPTSRREIPGWRPRRPWNNSLMEWTLILPLSSTTKQYVILIDLVNPHHVVEEWCIVYRTAPSWRITLYLKYHARVRTSDLGIVDSMIESA